MTHAQFLSTIGTLMQNKTSYSVFYSLSLLYIPFDFTDVIFSLYSLVVPRSCQGIGVHPRHHFGGRRGRHQQGVQRRPAGHVRLLDGAAAAGAEG